MAIRHLKTARSAEARAEDDAKTRAVVETTLADIEKRKLCHSFPLRVLMPFLG